MGTKRKVEIPVRDSTRDLLRQYKGNKDWDETFLHLIGKKRKK